MSNVTIIPATKNQLTRLPQNSRSKRKVAGYARVSTDSEEQLTSYNAQVDYYTKYIRSNPDWQFVNVYTDEGISATNTKRREGFNKMISDALSGKIDLIVTKSVSRFARNTVDSLTAVRKLKENGCEVYFEKENIYTFDSKGELLITIMSSLAQEESRSISENVTWGKRKAFADGKVSMPYSSVLGYKKGPNGTPVIDEEQAETVRLIYKLFISGKSMNSIARELESRNILTVKGRTHWENHTIESILTNEKYKGAAILQKYYTVDFLQKKMKKNEGELQQYYVENSHPAIISPDEWEAVQIEMKNRLGNDKTKRSKTFYPYSGKIFCGCCGEIYGPKVWQSNKKYSRIIWRCNHKYDNEEICRTRHLYEEEIQKFFLRALSKVSKDIDSLIRDCESIESFFRDNSESDNEISKLTEEMNMVEFLTDKLISDNASNPIPQDEYNEKYDELVQRYEAAQEGIRTAEKRKTRRITKADNVKAFKEKMIEVGSIPLEFREDIWHAAIDKVIVMPDDTLEFHFKTGKVITEVMK